MNIENQVKEILADALGFSGIDEIHSDDSLMDDLGADSIDFLDIIFQIEKKIGVSIDSNKFNVAGFDINDSEYVSDFKLTKFGAENLQLAFPDRKEKYVEGAALRSLLSSVSVDDFISIVRSKIITDYLLLQKDQKIDLLKVIDKHKLTQYGADVLIKYIPELHNEFKAGLTLGDLGRVYSNKTAQAPILKMLEAIKTSKQGKK
ncbi:MAG: phosphopantetheine-binding protein [Spirochaetia bacterium]|nr:phosphopantetheine-binding protein [Spirochaetia bacterium]